MAERFLTARDFARLPETGTLDPATVRFSQNSISPRFKGEHGSVAGLAEKLRSGQLSPAVVEPIRIVVKDGNVFTLDNRRLKAFRDAGVDTPYVKLDAIPEAHWFKFTTENEGVSVVVRDR